MQKQLKRTLSEQNVTEKLQEYHREPHRAGHRDGQAQAAHRHPDPEDVQRFQDQRAGAAVREKDRHDSVWKYGAAHPHGAVLGAEAGGQGEDHSIQSLRQLPYPAQREKGDGHHPAGEAGGISQRGGEVRRPAHVLSGAVQRPAAGRAAGPPVG